MRITVDRKSGGLRVRMRFEQQRNRWLAVRIMLGILAFQGAVVGLWAVLAPHSWYTSFPGFGMQWISADGPYNHHLASDVGSFFLALTAVTVAALFLGGSALAQVAGLGWLAFGLPHLIYHAFHKPADMGGASFTVSVIGAALIVALGLALILVTPRGPQLRDPAPITFQRPRRRTNR
ncbi:hypothetical protein ACIHDR_21360 [Nocardia sp. NPDC052278]|uniref:hypothetical protein n=1 Tax=unclassified Nocardia TaxID=2637762 RepID=UPI0036C5EAE7